MRYQGGKSRIATPLAQILNSAGGACFVSLFCGSCSVESKVTGYDRIILNDKHNYLIAMLKGVQAGYELPETVTEDQYQYIRANKDADPVLTGFVGFGCSFGGKWFGGYARNKGGTNYAAQSKRSLLKDMATLGGAEILCGDYRKLPIPPGAVVYADPPYAETTGYNGEKFNSTEFWRAMRLLADTGHTVFISEQTAPPDFVCVWEKPFTRTLDVNKGNQFKVTEKLFTYISPNGGTARAYYIASVSWGKDSLAMLLRLIGENRPLDEVVFFDTGMEFQAIYSTRDAVLPLLKAKGITYTELHPANDFIYTMLHKPVKGRERTGYGWCGGRCRWGTTEKLKLLDRYARHKDATVYIGIAADEPQRLPRLEAYKIAPLATLWGMNEAECLQYCYAQGYEWLEDGGKGMIRLYDVLDRVSCWCCCNKNLKELKNIYRLLPDYWQKLKYLQFCQERPMKGFYKGQPRGVMELEKRFEAEIIEEAQQ